MTQLIQWPAQSWLISSVPSCPVSPVKAFCSWVFRVTGIIMVQEVRGSDRWGRGGKRGQGQRTWWWQLRSGQCTMKPDFFKVWKFGPNTQNQNQYRYRTWYVIQTLEISSRGQSVFCVYLLKISDLLAPGVGFFIWLFGRSNIKDKDRAHSYCSFCCETWK